MNYFCASSENREFKKRQVNNSQKRSFRAQQSSNFCKLLDKPNCKIYSRLFCTNPKLQKLIEKKIEIVFRLVLFVLHTQNKSEFESKANLANLYFCESQIRRHKLIFSLLQTELESAFRRSNVRKTNANSLFKFANSNRKFKCDSTFNLPQNFPQFLLHYCLQS